MRWLILACYVLAVSFAVFLYQEHRAAKHMAARLGTIETKPQADDSAAANVTKDFSRAPLYIATPDRIVRPIKTGEIGTTARQEIGIPITIRIRIVDNNGNMMRFSFLGPRTYTIDRLERSDFTFLRPPLVPGKTWQVFNIARHGSHVIHTSFSHVLEAHSSISARINEELQTVMTPAGRFEDCLEIEYYETRSVETTEIETELIPEKYEEERAFLIAKIHETVATEFLKLIPNIPLGTLWLAPGVGPVKIETADGISELISYDVKTGGGL